MTNKITFLTKIIILILSIITTSLGEDIKIIPLGKPMLNQEVKEKKILDIGFDHVVPVLVVERQCVDEGCEITSFSML